MSTSNVSILVIDDQLDNLRALSRILQVRGYRVRQATNGETALKTAVSQPPDLILLDIRMPKMDGFAVCAALKQTPQTREIPIIFLSALGEAADKVRAFHSGGADYITKPFQVDEVLARIDNQLNLRSQQKQVSELLEQVQQLNSSLEEQIQAQTLELQQALEYERTLKQISDRVRDSLDKSYILQATVEELVRVLQVQCCDTIIYDASQTAEIICFHAQQDRLTNRYDSVTSLLTLPGVHHQLEQNITFAFCRYSPDVSDRYSASLACPIWDDRSWVGTLWLFKPLLSSFTQQEIHLVQQVANQCAIALRQARLYQEAQTQIVELQRLNQLKDDFLSTISHELRTPVANMRMVIQLLMLATEQGQSFLAQMSENDAENNRIVRYFRILQEECEREISLIQDLLDLQYLEAGARPLQLTTIDLNSWLLHVLERYELMAQNHQQQLTTELTSDLPPLTSDLSCLSRIVGELLNNACKFTPANESITVSTDFDSSHLLIRVCNSGVSISREELSRIFDKFYRIPNSDPWRYGGTGLGLALVRQLVGHIGASIEATSDEHSTRFTLYLPYSVETPLL